MAFPGGAGYGRAKSERPKELVLRDLARGYISAESAANVIMDCPPNEIKADVKTAVAKGEIA